MKLVRPFSLRTFMLLWVLVFALLILAAAYLSREAKAQDSVSFATFANGETVTCRDPNGCFAFVPAALQALLERAERKGASFGCKRT
jgi:hypothetical protein